VSRAAADAGAALADWPAVQGLAGQVRALRALAATGGIDVIHAYHTHAVKASVLGRLFGLRARVFLNRGVVTAANPLWGAFVRVTDGAIANSAAAAATLTARLAPDGRVNVIYNSCPPWPATPATPRGRAPDSGADVPLVVAWVGNAHPAKGFDVLAAAARRSRAALGPGAIRWVALGVGHEDRRHVAALAGDVVELAGVVSHEDVRWQLTRADLLVLTSRRRESLPNVVTEAFAAGLPVVVTDVGGVVELVRDGVNGYVCAAGDDATIARRVVSLALDPDARARMGALNGRLAVERLTLATKCAALLRVYSGDHVVEAPPVSWIDAATAEEWTTA
jgi:glycosyltransferase involved in cell wall biosynthesis